MVRLARLREWRERRAMTQRDLAQAAGVTQVTISRLEQYQHDPTPTTVRKLATALRVDSEQLMELGATDDD